MTVRDQLQSALGTAYTIERELGGGGMSRVFVAEEATLGRKVVVKVLAPELSGAVREEFQSLRGYEPFEAILRPKG